MKESILDKTVMIKWCDSYGVESGWRDISVYSANELIIESFGRVIYEDDKVISLAHNYSKRN